jgi:hypothetical protein
MSYPEWFMSKKQINEIPRECTFLLEDVLVNGLYIGEMEYCESSLAAEMEKIVKKKIPQIRAFLDRVIFQLLYTLLTVHQKFPDFVHSDFFVRNILVQNRADCANNERIRYCHDRTIYDMPANGVMVKINDFGMTYLTKKLGGNLKVGMTKPKNGLLIDLFNIIYDMYNGANFGSKSMMSLIKNDKKRRFLKKYFANFINIRNIDKIIKNKKKFLLDWRWATLQDSRMIKILFSKSPRQMMKYFARVFKKQSNSGSNIVEKYGKC